MDPLITLGQSLAPFAIACTVKISIAALAALAAARLLGFRRPSRAFAFILAAFALGSLLALPRGAGTPIASPVDYFLPERSRAATLRPSEAPPTATAGPGLTAKYGSLFQVRFTGIGPKASPETRSGPGPYLIGALGLIWLAGFVAISLHHAAGLLAVRALVASAEPCADGRILRMAASVRSTLDGPTAELRLSTRCHAPFVTGMFHPRILLPRDAIHWPADDLRATLLHEYAHLKRFDILLAEVLHALVSLAWLSPLPWLAFARALRSREEACDEAVLRTGMPPARYAAHLLAAARALSQTVRPSGAAAMIAAESHLEQRIRAILVPAAVRSPRTETTRNLSAALVLTAAATAIPLTGPLSSWAEVGPRVVQPEGPQEWLAVADPFAAPLRNDRGVFSLREAGGYAQIRVILDGRTSVCRVPATALPTGIPLTPRARMMLPFGDLMDTPSQRPFLNAGWMIWDDRGVPVKAAAPGMVVAVRLDPQVGPVIEVDHGAGLRSRYVLGRHGTSRVDIGEFVARGSELGTFGTFSPHDIPALQFSVLLHVRSRVIALDPAPFVLSGDNVGTPFSASVLNASIRIGDRAHVRRLIARSVSVNVPSADGTLPLEWVILTRNLAIGRDLIAAGADPQAPTWNIHQAHIALHGPTVAELARETKDADLIRLMTP